MPVKRNFNSYKDLRQQKSQLLTAEGLSADGKNVPNKKVAASDAFGSLLKRLIRVPKAELDEEERKYKAQRARLKKRGETKKKRGR